MPGLPMAFGGAMVAWGVFPLLLSPDLPGPLMGYPVLAPALYIGTTTVLSVVALGWTLTRHTENSHEVTDVQILSDLPEPPPAH